MEPPKARSPRRPVVPWSRDQDLTLLHTIREDVEAGKPPDYRRSARNTSLPHGETERDTIALHRKRFFNLRDKAFPRTKKREATSIAELIEFVETRETREKREKKRKSTVEPADEGGPAATIVEDGVDGGSEGEDEDKDKDSERSKTDSEDKGAAAAASTSKDLLLPHSSNRLKRIQLALHLRERYLALEFMLVCPAVPTAPPLIPGPEYADAILRGELALRLRPPLEAFTIKHSSIVSMLLDSPCKDFVPPYLYDVLPLQFLVQMLRDAHRPLYLYPLGVISKPDSAPLQKIVGPHHTRCHGGPDEVQFGALLKPGSPKDWAALFFVVDEMNKETCAPLLCLKPAVTPGSAATFQACAPLGGLRLIELTTLPLPAPPAPPNIAHAEITAREGTLAMSSVLFVSSVYGECTITFSSK